MAALTATLQREMKDPVMRGLIYLGAGYLGSTFLYSLRSKPAAPVPKKAPAPAAHHDDHSHKATPAAHVDDHHAAAPAAGGAKQQVAPVLQQLSNIADRLSKIEKALGL